MSAERIDADEELLLSILERRVERDSREAHQLVERRPELRPLLEDLETVMHEIDRSSASDRSLVAGIGSAIRDRDREQVERFVREKLRVAPAPRALERRRPAWFAVAAAILLMAVGAGAWLLLRGDGRPKDQWLGDPPRLLEPGETARDFTHFVWSIPGSSKARVELEICEDAGAGARGRELARHTTEASEWSFTPDETKAWPDTVVWSVTVIDAAGEQQGLSSSRSSRRSR